MVKPDLLTGWRPHYAEEGDISMQRPGDGPEGLQMHSDFIQAAGLEPTEEAVTSVGAATLRTRGAQLTDLIRQS